MSKQTSEVAARSASKMLRGRTAKTVAGSALSQKEKSKK
jgi:hypothetical protein